MAEGVREQSFRRDGMQIDVDVPLEMSDGVVLRADVFHPLSEGRFPVLLSYGPYGKALAFQKGYPDQWGAMIRQHPDVTTGSTSRYQNWEVADPEKWVPEGYACVRVDARGAGRSPGVLEFLAPRETQDLYEAIEWAAVRPWSNGKVGLLGISYYAMNQWLVASRQPPHLAAICPWEGAADFYRDATRHGGIASDFWGNWFHTQVREVQHGYGERGEVDENFGLQVAGPETLSDAELEQRRVDLEQQVLARPFDDAFYRDRSPDWSKVTVPLLSAANWGGQGLHPRGNFEGFTQAASRQKWLEVHGLEHWTHFYTDYGRTLQLRFFDFFLKGVANGWDRQPRVLLQVRHVDRFVQRAETAWPLSSTVWTKLYLQPKKRMLAWKPDPDETEASYPALGGGLTLMSLPFSVETEITGPIAAKVFLSSSTTDADLFVTLRAFAPDGKEVDFQGALDPHTPIGQGWLRASHRRLDLERTLAYRPYHTHDRFEPLTPGEICELDIEILPTSFVVPVGYSIGLTLQGKDFERAEESGRLATVVRPMRGSGPFTHTLRADRPPEVFGGIHTIIGGGSHASHLLLPVIPPPAQGA